MPKPLFGSLGKIDIDGATNTINTDIILYTCPASRRATVNVNFTNRSGSTALVRLAHVDHPGAPSAGDLEVEDHLEFNLSLKADETFERAGITIAFPTGSNQQSLVIRSDTTDVNFVAQGIEEDE